jgi:RHS Repeat
VNANRNYAVNGLNQYASSGPRCFDYDGNGNLTADKNCAAPNDGTRTDYVYDVENRLVSATGVSNASLRYDPLGRLYETGTNLTPSASTVRFFYDGDELVAEYTASGSMLRQYGHGSGNDDPVYMRDYVGCCSFFLHADHQGSIVAVTGASTNAAVINRYDEWGIPGAGNIGRFQYTGRRGSPNWACITTKPASTRPPSGGSCRPIPSATRIR